MPEGGGGIRDGAAGLGPEPRLPFGFPDGPACPE
jgi:hypothetical protein